MRALGQVIPNKYVLNMLICMCYITLFSDNKLHPIDIYYLYKGHFSILSVQFFTSI